MDDINIKRVRVATEESLDRIREHRFIQQAHAGQLGRAQVLRWILCGGRESRTFPEILENMVTRVDNPLVLQILRENLADEYGNGNPDEAHFQHYRHLLHDVGLTDAEFESYEERAGIRLALDLAYNVSSQPVPEIAIGYMLVNEGMTPITYDAVDVAIHRYFPSLETMFFKLHVEVDEHHVNELYRAIAELENDSVDDLLFGVSLGERGMGVLLDEALGVFDHVAGT
jgi:pyrroloquinoline quinone (PQQ) biosynthesis protein C